MITRAFVAQGAFDQHEVWGWPDRPDLAGRSHADQQLAAGHEQLFGNEHREGCTYGETDNADGNTVLLRDVHLGVIASPSVSMTRASACSQRANNVTVRIQGADSGHRRARTLALAACLPKKVLWLKDRGRVILLRAVYRRCLLARVHAASCLKPAYQL
jgi:hypothetical protein